jgi:general secretion pathway protein D
VILRDADSYAGLTHGRYDYVIGQQRASGEGGTRLLREPAPPMLPPLEVPGYRAPISDAVVMPVAQTAASQAGER